MSNLIQPLKWHGGKHYLAKRIIDLFPPHIHYVEPYFGGGSVLLSRDPMDERFWIKPHKGVSEVANDLNLELTNFWRILQGDTFRDFKQYVEAIPMSAVEWREYGEAEDPIYEDALSSAIKFFVRARQSRAGMMKDFTSITRARTRRGMNGNVSEWLSAVDGLADVHARLRRVLIENMPALDLICREDTPETLFYCDPPYIHSSRASSGQYAHEMSDQDHEQLIRLLCTIKGKVVLSGYPSELYRVFLEVRHGWRFIDFDLPNNAAGGKKKRRMTERVWMNY